MVEGRRRDRTLHVQHDELHGCRGVMINGACHRQSVKLAFQTSVAHVMSESSNGVGVERGFVNVDSVHDVVVDDVVEFVVGDMPVLCM